MSEPLSLPRWRKRIRSCPFRCPLPLLLLRKNVCWLTHVRPPISFSLPLPPQCKTVLAPDAITTCAFVKCNWTLKGNMKEEGNPMGRNVERVERAGDAYHRMVEGGDDTILWNFLHLTVTPL